MAKYRGVTQNPDGSWSYRIKKKVNGVQIDTKIKKDQIGRPFLTAAAAYDAKLFHESQLGLSKPIKKTTLSDIYDSYMSSSESKKKAPSTIRKQESMWKNHVNPKFGKVDINSIKITDLNEFLFNLYQEHAYAYVEGFLKFFYLLFGYAYNLELIDTDRYYRMFIDKGTRLTMPPKNQADTEDELKGATVYSDEEILAIRDVFKSEGGNLLTAFRFGAYCGLRISECFAVRWSDISPDYSFMYVKRQLHNMGGKITLSSVKTMKSIRYIPIPKPFQELLKEHHKQQEKEKKELGPFYKATETVYDEVTGEFITGGDFVNRKSDGTLLTDNSMKYWSKKIKSELGIEFKYHNLRHTYATQCAIANVNSHILMNILGHKKYDTTMKYYNNVSSFDFGESTQKKIDLLYNNGVKHKK